MFRPTNSTKLIFVVDYKLWAAILYFLQISVIASLLGAYVFVSTLQSSILSIPHKLSPFRFSVIFQMAYSKANMNTNKSQELQI
jgi:hypothetical protein